MAKSSSTSSLWESLLSEAAWHLVVRYCLTSAHLRRRTTKVGYVIGSPDWFTQKRVDPPTGRKSGSREAHSNQGSINVHVFITLHTVWIQERPFLKCNGGGKGRFSFIELALRICLYHPWSLISIKLHCEENLTLNLINYSLGKSSQWEMKALAVTVESLNPCPHQPSQHSATLGLLFSQLYHLNYASANQ